MNSNNNLFKYIFAVVVVFLLGYTVYIIFSNKSEVSEESLDQTSTLSNIQTELRFAIAGLDTFNPILSNNRNVLEVSKLVYEPLVTLNENYKAEYVLAKEIAKAEDNSYIIKLKDNVKWSDGTNVTIADLDFTIDLIKNGKFYTTYQNNLKHVVGRNKVDDTTIRLYLDQEVPFFEYYLTFPIMCEHYYESDDDFIQSGKIPIGTGMFEIFEVSSNMIKLRPRTDYWNTSKKAMATQININLYNNMSEVYNAFKNGEIDILSIQSNDVENYIGTLGYKKIEYKSRDYDFLALNTQNGIMQNKNVRRAISLVIDKNYIAASVVGPGYTPSNFSIDFGSWLYTKDLNILPDTEQATALLMADGWILNSNEWQRKVDGRTEKLTVHIAVDSSNQRRINVVETIKNQLEMFGINVDVDYVSNDNYKKMLENKNYEILIAGVETSYSPDLTTFFGNGNLANFYTDESVNIMNIVKNTSEDNKLYDCYNRIFDIYIDEVPYIGLYRSTDIVVYNQNLVGNITPNLFNIYHNIEKWYRQ